jgi:hypothetical protein
MTANDLADRLEQFYTGTHIDKAAETLRQQAQEIESLKNANRFIQNFAEEQHQRAVALEMRELTDEEIMEIYDRVELYNIDEGQMYLKPIEFAKELLKKASEK